MRFIAFLLFAGLLAFSICQTQIDLNGLNISPDGARLQTRSDTAIDCPLGKFRKPGATECETCPNGFEDCRDPREPSLCPVGQWFVLTPGKPATCAAAIPTGYVPFKYAFPIPATDPTAEQRFRPAAIEAIINSIGGQFTRLIEMAKQIEANPEERTLAATLFPDNTAITTPLTALTTAVKTAQDAGTPAVGRAGKNKLFVNLFHILFKLHKLAIGRDNTFDFTADTKTVFSIVEAAKHTDGTAIKTNEPTTPVRGIAVPCVQKNNAECAQRPEGFFELIDNTVTKYVPRCPFGFEPTGTTCTALTGSFATIKLVPVRLKFTAGQSPILPIIIEVQGVPQADQAAATYQWKVKGPDGTDITTTLQIEETTGTKIVVIPKNLEEGKVYKFECAITINNVVKTFVKDVALDRKPKPIPTVGTTAKNGVQVPTLKIKLTDVPLDFTTNADGTDRSPPVQVLVELVPKDSTVASKFIKVDLQKSGEITIEVPPNTQDTEYKAKISFEGFTYSQTIDVRIPATTGDFGNSAFGDLQNFNPASPQNSQFVAKAFFQKAKASGTNGKQVFQAGVDSLFTAAANLDAAEGLQLLGSIAREAKDYIEPAQLTQIITKLNDLFTKMQTEVGAVTTSQTIGGATFDNPDAKPAKAKVLVKEFIKVITGLIKTLNANTDNEIKKSLQELWKKAVAFASKNKAEGKSQTIATEDSAVTTTTFDGTATGPLEVPIAIEDDDAGAIGDLEQVRTKPPRTKLPQAVLNTLKGAREKIFISVSVVKCNIAAGFSGCGNMNTWCTEVTAVDEDGVEIPANNFSEAVEVEVPPNAGQTTAQSFTPMYIDPVTKTCKTDGVERNDANAVNAQTGNLKMQVKHFTTFVASGNDVTKSGALVKGSFALLAVILLALFAN